MLIAKIRDVKIRDYRRSMKVKYCHNQTYKTLCLRWYYTGKLDNTTGKCDISNWVKGLSINTVIYE